jgi:hypothetical protein
MDDLWLYDINGHRWVCCYPGADTKSLDLVIDRDGFEATRDGERVPVAQQVHAYSMNTYDTARRRFLSMPNTHEYWQRALPQRKRWLKPPPADAGPWSFDPATGKWDRRRTGAPAPRSGYGDTFLYLPDRVQAFWVYDLKADRWVDPRPKGKPCKGSNSYSTLNALMAYDSANDKVLLVFHSYHYDRPERLGVYIYDPGANAWTEEPLALPERLRNRQVKNGFYDPELNAVFLHSAGDSQDNGTIWVYRYRKPG